MAWRGLAALLVVGVGLVAAACAAANAEPVESAQAPAGAAPEIVPPRLTPAPNAPGDPNAGRALFVSAGCGGCHTLSGVPSAVGVSGPNLANVVVRPTLAGESIPMTPETLTRWLVDPAALKPGTSMPSVGLTEGEARDIAAFLYSQPYNR